MGVLDMKMQNHSVHLFIPQILCLSSLSPTDLVLQLLLSRQARGLFSFFSARLGNSVTARGPVNINLYSENLLQFQGAAHNQR